MNNSTQGFSNIQLLLQSTQLTPNIQQLPHSMPTCIQQPYNMPTHNVFTVNFDIQSNIIQQADITPEYIQQNATPARLYEDTWKSSQSVKIISEHSEKLVRCMIECNLRSYDSSQFSDHKFIGSGRCAMVYSAIFEEKSYALKSLNNNLRVDDESIEEFIREVV
ncbi:6060_t:CDS:2 [Scutellospora calospora]|uniref:6060_t:CDS:1 n=1 Tax=Scutellospora calospora TaxID=85575 RepID=A0ACA9KHD7_9GLOM|nr:6060_t:CDS:2 [Scutellospora calospora]